MQLLTARLATEHDRARTLAGELLLNRRQCESLTGAAGEAARKYNALAQEHRKCYSLRATAAAAAATAAAGMTGGSPSSSVVNASPTSSAIPLPLSGTMNTGGSGATIVNNAALAPDDAGPAAAAAAAIGGGGGSESIQQLPRPPLHRQRSASFHVGPAQVEAGPASVLQNISNASTSPESPVSSASPSSSSAARDTTTAGGCPAPTNNARGVFHSGATTSTSTAAAGSAAPGTPQYSTSTSFRSSGDGLEGTSTSAAGVPPHRELSESSFAVFELSMPVYSGGDGVDSDRIRHSASNSSASSTSSTSSDYGDNCGVIDPDPANKLTSTSNVDDVDSPAVVFTPIPPSPSPRLSTSTSFAALHGATGRVFTSDGGATSTSVTGGGPTSTSARTGGAALAGATRTNGGRDRASSGGGGAQLQLQVDGAMAATGRVAVPSTSTLHSRTSSTDLANSTITSTATTTQRGDGAGAMVPSLRAPSTSTSKSTTASTTPTSTWTSMMPSLGPTTSLTSTSVRADAVFPGRLHVLIVGAKGIPAEPFGMFGSRSAYIRVRPFWGGSAALSHVQLGPHGGAGTPGALFSPTGTSHAAAASTAGGAALSHTAAGAAATITPHAASSASSTFGGGGGSGGGAVDTVTGPHVECYEQQHQQQLPYNHAPAPASAAGGTASASAAAASPLLLAKFNQVRVLLCLHFAPSHLLLATSSSLYLYISLFKYSQFFQHRPPSLFISMCDTYAGFHHARVWSHHRRCPSD